MGTNHKPSAQTVSVRTPISIRSDAPPALAASAARQITQLDDARKELERQLWEAGEVAKKEGLVPALIYAMRADRRNTVEALQIMASEADAMKNTQRAVILREVAALLTPQGG